MSYPNGIYQHFKGGIYRVVTVARKEATPDILEVIYQAVASPDELPWSRPLEDWNSDVPWPDGVSRPRFIRWCEVPDLA